MKTTESNPKIPRQIEMELDTIRGLLQCSNCDQQIAYNGEVGIHISNNHSKSIQQSIDQHLCHNISFKYDFNSPLTIKEQYELSKAQIKE